jgi:hypothetical protein
MTCFISLSFFLSPDSNSLDSYLGSRVITMINAQIAFVAG